MMWTELRSHVQQRYLFLYYSMSGVYCAGTLESTPISRTVLVC